MPSYAHMSTTLQFTIDRIENTTDFVLLNPAQCDAAVDKLVITSIPFHHHLMQIGVTLRLFLIMFDHLRFTIELTSAIFLFTSHKS